MRAGILKVSNPADGLWNTMVGAETKNAKEASVTGALCLRISTRAISHNHAVTKGKDIVREDTAQAMRMSRGQDTGTELVVLTAKS